MAGVDHSTTYELLGGEKRSFKFWPLLTSRRARNPVGDGSKAEKHRQSAKHRQRFERQLMRIRSSLAWRSSRRYLPAMRDKAFVAVAVCAVLGLCISTGTAVYLATQQSQPADVRVISPQAKEAEDVLELHLVNLKVGGKANEDDLMRLQILRERKFLRELWEMEHKGR